MTGLTTDMTELRLQLTVARAALGRAEDFLTNPATAAAAGR